MVDEEAKGPAFEDAWVRGAGESAFGDHEAEVAKARAALSREPVQFGHDSSKRDEPGGQAAVEHIG